MSIDPATGRSRKLKAPKEEGDAGRVSINGLHKSFGETEVLRDVHLSIRGGEFVTLLGPSGCGKSTLLRTIAGLERSGQGEIVIGGNSMKGVPSHKRPVSMVFQDLALFPHMTVLDNIAYPLRNLGISKRSRRAEAREYLEIMELRGFDDRHVGELSGGQKQRVALARALARKPDVLLLDEPLSALDRKLRRQMQVELKEFQTRMGTTFIFVTHDQEEALVMSDRIAVMNNGRVDQFGGPLDVYANPSSRFVAEFVGDMNFVPAKWGPGEQDAIYGNVSVAVLKRTDTRSLERLWILVRPEDMRVRRSGYAEGDSETMGWPLRGKVDDVLFYGDSVLTSVSLFDGSRVVARTRVGAFGDRLQTGENVAVDWDRDACAVIDRDTDANHIVNNLLNRNLGEE